MKVCVVGGNGNIGFSVAKHLLQIGHEVTCFNRGLSGKIPDGAKLIKGNREDFANYIKVIRSHNFDAAIDMSCYHANHAKSSIEAFTNVKHFINCSSVATYGREFKIFPVKEDHALHPEKDRNVNYAIGKAKADEEFIKAHKNNDFPVTILKPSISYGPKMGLLRQLGMDFTFFDRIKNDKPILIAGDGIAFHQFMHVDDVGLAFALTLGKPELIGETFNVTNQYPISWFDYHEIIMDVLGNNVEQIGVPTAILNKLNNKGLIYVTDIFWQNSYFCTEKFRKAIPEFTPKISLKEGISSVLKELEVEKRLLKCPDKNWEDELIKLQINIKLKRKNPNILVNSLSNLISKQK